MNTNKGRPKSNRAWTKLIALLFVTIGAVAGKVLSDTTDDLGAKASKALGTSSAPKAPRGPLTPEPIARPLRPYTVDITPDGRPGPRILADMLAEANSPGRHPIVEYGMVPLELGRVLAVRAALDDWGQRAHGVGTPKSDGSGGSSTDAAASATRTWRREGDMASEEGTLEIIVEAETALDAMWRAVRYVKLSVVSDFLAAWGQGCLSAVSPEVRQAIVRTGVDVESRITNFVVTCSSGSTDQLFEAVALIVNVHRNLVAENHETAGT